jgi:uroporphyrinogen-III synthase
VLTSANGARAVVDRLHACRRRLPDGTRVAAVGPATAGTLRSAGVAVDHVPRRYLTVAIADGLGDVGGRRVVLARADAATEDLGDVLRERGAIVEEAVAYRTIEGPSAGRDRLRAALTGELDGVTFTSSSTVRGLMRMASLIDRARARAIPAFCIGPVTAATARRAGFAVAAVAAEHTAAGLAGATADHFARKNR